MIPLLETKMGEPSIRVCAMDPHPQRTNAQVADATLKIVMRDISRKNHC